MKLPSAVSPSSSQLAAVTTASLVGASLLVVLAARRRTNDGRPSPCHASASRDPTAVFLRQVVAALEPAQASASLSSSIPSAPCAVVDLDAFDRNVRLMCDAVAAPMAAPSAGRHLGGRAIRVATKSIRCVELIRRLCSTAAAASSGSSSPFAGLMTFTANETAALFDHPLLADVRVPHMLLAYPMGDVASCVTMARLHVKRLALPAAEETGRDRPGAPNRHSLPTVATMVDCAAHVDLIVAACREAAARALLPTADWEPFRIWIDVDMSFRPAGPAGPHLGVRRSPIRGPVDAAVVLAAVRTNREWVRVEGIMGYEAQIAGLPDVGQRDANSTGPSRWLNRIIAAAKGRFKHASLMDCAARRGAMSEFIRQHFADTTLLSDGAVAVNGGGSGSLRATVTDPSVTEITVGSGATCGHIFSRYEAMPYEPALFFALRVTRVPVPSRGPASRSIVTCHGGGWVASGEAGRDRLPMVVWPPGAELLSMEGAGEVQTPVVLPPGVSLPVGGVVVFRPAKSGELAEVFSRYFLVARKETGGKSSTPSNRPDDPAAAAAIPFDPAATFDLAVAEAATYRGDAVESWGPSPRASAV